MLVQQFQLKTNGSAMVTHRSLYIQMRGCGMVRLSRVSISDFSISGCSLNPSFALQHSSHTTGLFTPATALCRTYQPAICCESLWLFYYSWSKIAKAGIVSCKPEMSSSVDLEPLFIAAELLMGAE